MNDAACYLRGTLILTADGEVPIEDLVEGDLLVTASGASRPVKWLGRRSHVTRLVPTHARDDRLPIRFARCSLADGLPRRDLFVSPEHAMFIDGMLIPARHLVNGASIARCTTLPTIEYYHVELASHDVVLAEGVAAETWLDRGDRDLFANVLEYQGPAAEGAPQPPCAPIVTAGPRLEAVRDRLHARIAAAGFELTNDPGLRLLANEVPVPGVFSSAKVFRAALAERPETLVIGSQISVPRDVDPASNDQRQLGVCIKRIALKGPHVSVEIGHDEPTLRDGFHAAEPDHRWTQGRAAIPPQFLACLIGPVTVEVHLAARELRYARRIGGNTVLDSPGTGLVEPPACRRSTRGAAHPFDQPLLYGPRGRDRTF